LASIFTKIINNEIPCYKVAETENCFAFLDINPNAEGHTLCIPKQEVDNLFDLDTKLYNELMMFSKKVAKALKKAIPCERVAMSVIGLEVPHAHVHLIPVNEMKDVTFRNKVTFSKNEFQDIANNIKSYL
jgi:histidine triad (HIT) family protein|tara:strand:+ start:2105 stop:2494 length:390 start_codon:yes stop_codon:yes gene_type:complete